MAVICGGVVYIYNMTQTFQIWKKFLDSQNFQPQMFFSFNLLGKIMLETFLQHELFVKNVF